MAVAVALAMAASSSLAQAITAGSSCSAVLQQGVYNTFQTTRQDSSYYEAHQSACQDYSSYTYE